MTQKKQPSEPQRIYLSDMERLKVLKIQFEAEISEKSGVPLKLTMPEVINKLITEYLAATGPRNTHP